MQRIKGINIHCAECGITNMDNKVVVRDDIILLDLAENWSCSSGVIRCPKCTAEFNKTEGYINLSDCLEQGHEYYLVFRKPTSIVKRNFVFNHCEYDDSVSIGRLFDIKGNALAVGYFSTKWLRMVNAGSGEAYAIKLRVENGLISRVNESKDDTAIMQTLIEKACLCSDEAFDRFIRRINSER